MEKGLLHRHNFVISSTGLKTLSIPIAASKVRHPSPLVIPTGAKRSGVEGSAVLLES
jgi:hypothetical protein